MTQHLTDEEITNIVTGNWTPGTVAAFERAHEGLGSERKEYHVRMAKANPDEVEKLRKFMADLEETIDDVGLDGDYRNLGEWVCNNFPQWRRVVEGYPILVESACDPALTYLDWKPDLKKLIEANSTEAAQ